MFIESFDACACIGEEIACEVDNFHCVATIHDDSATGAPWQRDDGHGPVSEWTTRDKKAGERILNSDRDSKRYYDFAEAVKIAKRDGWGIVNSEGMTAGQIAEAAAQHDYEVLRAWCNDEWCYVGISVTVFKNGIELGDASLWGVEMNYPGSNNAYLAEVANELLPEALQNARDNLAKLCAD